MASHPVVGIYNSVARARLAQEALIEEGVPEDRVAISIDLTRDGIAAEAPGQSYANQPDDRPRSWSGSSAGAYVREGPRPGRADAAHCGTCVVTAEARDRAEADHIQEVMTALRAIRIEVAAA